MTNETQTRYEAHDYIEDRREQDGLGRNSAADALLGLEVLRAERIAGAVALLAEKIGEAEGTIHTHPVVVIEAIVEALSAVDLPSPMYALILSLAKAQSTRVASPVGEGV